MCFQGFMFNSSSTTWLITDTYHYEFGNGGLQFEVKARLQNCVAPAFSTYGAHKHVL